MFAGSIPALITPFRDDKVDDEAFARLVERQIAAGSAGLVPCGTTGETSTLSHDEHQHVVELCVKVAGGRVPVIAGAGSNSTKEAIDFMRHAKSVGAHAGLVVAPYYNRPSPEGMFAHFAAINEAVQLPIIVYNVPARTASDILPETMGRIASLSNVIGVKDATAQLDRVARHEALCGDNFIQLSGEDSSAVGFNSMGGRGCISVTANVAPQQCARLQDACARGDYGEARAINARLARLHRAMFLHPSPAPAKYALAAQGLCSEEIRLPLTQISSAEVKAEIDAALLEAGES